MEVSVIGGGGHVGLGMCLVLAHAGHFVYGIDIDEKKNCLINSGKMPFIEKLGQEYLNQALDKKRLVMLSDLAVVKDSQVIVVVLSTPIDENLNPVITPLRELFVQISPLLEVGQTIILRSTVSPGTTDLVKKLIEKNTGLSVGKDIYLAYAPERVAQGEAILELPDLPQLIGAFDEASYAKVSAFFKSFINAECFSLTPLEAEVAKLVTNMTRYVTFALVNEYHLIGDILGVNINKIIDACNKDYPRLNLPSPGPNVGGPCLYKDGWFLIERIPYQELISTAFRINEGMPMQILQKLRQYPHIEKVTVLGMTYKANSDDIRNSLSFKLKKQLDALGYVPVLIDPFLEDRDPLDAMADSDAVVLMTPHHQFKDLAKLMEIVSNDECLYVDIWGFWSVMRHRSQNGYFFGKEVPQ